MALRTNNGERKDAQEATGAHEVPCQTKKVQGLTVAASAASPDGYSRCVKSVISE